MTAQLTTALIADDEPHLANHLRSQLAALWPELRLLPNARNGIDAAAAIAAHAPDLAFLDIQMPGLSGLDVAQGIDGTTRVVFVTAYDEFAVQAFEREAIDYLLKPVTAERLARCVERVRRALASRPEAPTADDARLANALRHLALRTTSAPVAAAAADGRAHPHPHRLPPPLRYLRASQGDLTHQIDIAEVLFFRADDKYTCVQTRAGEHLIRTSIAELVAQLDPQRFWQVHRSSVVNLDHVAGTRRDDLSRLFVRLRGFDGELPVSRAYVHLFKAM